jgi:hypothetical protein
MSTEFLNLEVMCEILLFLLEKYIFMNKQKVFGKLFTHKSSGAVVWTISVTSK